MLGLQCAYRSRNTVRHIIKELTALDLLPSDDILDIHPGSTSVADYCLSHLNF